MYSIVPVVSRMYMKNPRNLSDFPNNSNSNEEPRNNLGLPKIHEGTPRTSMDLCQT